MPIPTHLTEGDYDKLFPAAADEFPTVNDDEHYIDAWLLNSAFDSVLAVEQYLLEHKSSIEAPIGDDIVGEEGQLEISIPSAYYPAYKSSLAWDSNLLEENIKSGETIFGVLGTLEAVGGGISISLPAVAAIADAWVYRAPPTLTMDAAVPSVAVPAVSAA